MTTDALAQLVDLLDLEQLEPTVFRGYSPLEDQHRVFGGQVASQALVAAGRTVPADRGVHSLHGYFLRPGDPSVPIVFHVDCSRDGRSFSARRVAALQRGAQIFTLAASFQLSAPGLEHQQAMPAVPDPDQLPTTAERLRGYGVPTSHWAYRPWPIDVRYVEDPPWSVCGGSPREPRQLVWMRADGTLPVDPLLHACVLTYASDFSLLDSVLLAHGLSWDGGGVKVASLDHAMWFHRPPRVDEWLLYAQDSPSAADARGFCRGELFGRDGRLAVSVAQEGMFRTTR